MQMAAVMEMYCHPMAPNTIAVTNLKSRLYMRGHCWPKADGSCLAATHFANSLMDSLPNRPMRDGRVEKNSWPRNCSRNGCYTSRSGGYCNLSRPCCCCCRSRRVGCWKYLPATVPDYWTPSPGRHGLPHMHYSAQLR